MKSNQSEQLFSELTAEFETSTFKELDDEVAATCSGGGIFFGGSNPDVILYDGKNFGLTGKGALEINATKNGGDSNLDNELIGSGWNNITSSILVIRGTWKIYRDSGFKGPSVTLKRGFYANPKAFGLADNTLTGIKRLS